MKSFEHLHNKPISLFVNGMLVILINRRIFREKLIVRPILITWHSKLSRNDSKHKYEKDSNLPKGNRTFSRNFALNKSGTIKINEFNGGRQLPDIAELRHSRVAMEINISLDHIYFAID